MVRSLSGGTELNCAEIEKSALIERYVAGDLAGGERDRLEEHLLACETCREQLEDLSLLRERFGQERWAVQDERVESRRPWSWVLVAAAAVLALAVILWPRWVGPPESSDDRVGQLTQVQPPPFEPKSLRSGGGESESLFRKAMTAYQEGQFREAIPGLEAAVELDPDLTPARFYLGASYLLTGDARKAADCLSVVLETEDSPYREWALWLRSKASLGLGDVAAARRDLEEVVQRGGDLEAQAQEALNQLPD